MEVRLSGSTLIKGLEESSSSTYSDDEPERDIIRDLRSHGLRYLLRNSTERRNTSFSKRGSSSIE